MDRAIDDIVNNAIKLAQSVKPSEREEPMIEGHIFDHTKSDHPAAQIPGIHVRGKPLARVGMPRVK